MVDMVDLDGKGDQGQVSIVIFGMLESSGFGVEDHWGQDGAGGGVLHLLLFINGIFCKYHQMNRLLVDYECGTEAAKQVNGNNKDSSLFSTTQMTLVFFICVSSLCAKLVFF